MLHVGNLGAKNAMLIRLMVVSPVETRVILHIAVPCLRYVNLAVSGPREWLLREKPECRPDTRRARRCEVGGEDALIARQSLTTYESSRGIPLRMVRLCIVRNSS